jgi:hypothetical protein
MQAALADDMAALLIDVPLEVLFDLGLGPAVRLVAAGVDLEPGMLDRMGRACWRAITRE